MKTIKEINTKINQTIGKQKKLRLPPDDAKNELEPKKTKAVLKIGNLVQIETNIGSIICKISDLAFHLELYADKVITPWTFYNFYGKHPHNWNDAVFMLEAELHGIKSKAEFTRWKKDVSETDLMDNKDVVKRLQRTIDHTEKRLKG